MLDQMTTDQVPQEMAESVKFQIALKLLVEYLQAYNDVRTSGWKWFDVEYGHPMQYTNEELAACAKKYAHDLAVLQGCRFALRQNLGI